MPLHPPPLQPNSRWKWVEANNQLISLSPVGTSLFPSTEPQIPPSPNDSHNTAATHFTCLHERRNYSEARIPLATIWTKISPDLVVIHMPRVWVCQIGPPCRLTFLVYSQVSVREGQDAVELECKPPTL